MKNDKPSGPPTLQARLGIAHYLPKLWKINLTVVSLTAGALLVWPVLDTGHSRRGSWSGGPVTNHHRLLEQTCSSCHPVAFSAVPDQSCTECHEVRAHADTVAPIVKKHPELGERCVNCHKEHHDEESLIPTRSILCTECHNRINELSPETDQPNFNSFLQHPEFSVQVWMGEPPELRKVQLGEPGLRSVTQLKFSHARHLTLADNPLQCANCHEFGDHLVKPVTFLEHCESCHDLKFDETPDSPTIPHRAADHVYDFVRWEVTRQRVILGDKAALNKAAIASESRDAEAALFTQGGECVRCHDVHEVADADDNQSSFRIEPPAPTSSMSSAVFDHQGHRFTPCEQCHQGIRDSLSAGDLLLPSISVCRDCHADPGTPGKTDSHCLQCHNYHQLAH